MYHPIHSYLHSLKHSAIVKHNVAYREYYTCILSHRLYIMTMGFTMGFLFHDDLLSLSYETLVIVKQW